MQHRARFVPSPATDGSLRTYTPGFPGINGVGSGLTLSVKVIRFGVFEAHLAAGELYKTGRLVRLQQQPFGVLRVLLERPGEVVTRDDLRRSLWPEGITVDFDQSLNKCVTKLRDALGDQAASPRFIETLPKRGYRFIADVRSSEEVPDEAAPDTALVEPPIVALPVRPVYGASRATWIPGLTTVAVLAVTTLGLGVTEPPATRLEARANVVRKVGTAATRSPIFAARDAYERGRAALSRRSEESLQRGLEHFSRAIALSPRYAEAYVGLADSWSLLASYGMADPRDAMPRARDAANRALMLDASLARAHAALGRTTMIYDWDWRTAEFHFTRALALEPGDATTHQWYAYYLSATGHHDEAIDEARRAVAAEPLSLSANTALGFVLYLARRPDEAAAQLERTLAIDPDFSQARRDLGLVRVQQGRYTNAVAELRRVATLNERSPAAQAELGWAQAIAGDRPAALAILNALDRERATRYVPPDSLALLHAALGANDQAIACLERAATMRVASLSLLAVDPMWLSLARDGRVQDLIRTVGALEATGPR